MKWLKWSFLKTKLPSHQTLLRISAVLTLFALALMIWQLFDPTVVPIMVAMSLGQVLGTIAFAAYGYVVFQDLMRQRRERRDSLREIPKP